MRPVLMLGSLHFTLSHSLFEMSNIIISTCLKIQYYSGFHYVRVTSEQAYGHHVLPKRVSSQSHASQPPGRQTSQRRTEEEDEGWRPTIITTICYDEMILSWDSNVISLRHKMTHARTHTAEFSHHVNLAKWDSLSYFPPLVLQQFITSLCPCSVHLYLIPFIFRWT